MTILQRPFSTASPKSKSFLKYSLAAAGLGGLSYGTYRWLNATPNHPILDAALKKYKSTLISTGQANSILTINQTSSCAALNNQKLGIHVNSVASNSPIEDAFTMGLVPNGLILG